MGWRQVVFPLLIIDVTTGFSGLFVYSPTVGAGNLIYSVTAQAGTDPFGNAYLGSSVEYFQFTNGNVGAMQSTAGGLGWYLALSHTGPWNALASFSMQLAGPGDTPLATLSTGLALGSALTGADPVMATVVPTGDTTGVLDTDLWNALLTSPGFQTLEPAPGDYYIKSGVLNLIAENASQHGQFIRGAGKSATTIHAIDNGGSFPPVINIHNTSGHYAINVNCGVRDLSIDGTGTTNSNGIEFGDVVGVELDELDITNFPDGTGIYANNRQFFTEQWRGKVYVSNCFSCMTLDVNGGTSSFDRPDFLLIVNCFDGQRGMIFAGGATGCGWTHGTFKLEGNFNIVSGAGGGFCVACTGTNNFADDSEFSIGVEIDGVPTGSGTYPQTFSFQPSSRFYRNHGGMGFFGPWVASNNNGNFSYNGYIDGDFSLWAKADTIGVTVITSGFPAGWSGNLNFFKSTDTGLFHVDVALSVAASTTITLNEVIASVGQGFFYPSDNKVILVQLATPGGGSQIIPIVIDPSGNVRYGGITQTLPAGGASFIYGQATPTNSW